MRALATSLLACGLMTGLASCAPKAEYESTIADQRFDLLAFNMPDLLVADAKRCVATSRQLRGQGGAQESVSETLFESILDLWQFVDVSMIDGKEGLEVLPKGGSAEGIESILPKIKIPATVGHACGEYAGEVAVSIGLTSLNEMIEVAVKANPTVFEDMGTSLPQVRAGVEMIEAQAGALNALSVKDKVQCMAIYQSARVSDDSLAPFVSIWLASLVDLIESAALDPANIRGQSEYWQTMATDGANAVISMDNFKADATKCDDWINAAIAEQAAAQ